MKRYIFLLLMFTLCIDTNAQELVHFEITSNGSFKTKEGNNFVVVPFEGKTSDELYNKVKNNVMSFYKSPQKVMSENDGQVISIRAITIVAMKTVTMLPRSFDSYYNLVFRFKDGKVRVDIPTIDNDMSDHAGMLMPNSIPTFQSYCKDLFDKNGVVKPKRKERKDFTENSINSIINNLLGLTKANVTSDDNW